MTSMDYGLQRHELREFFGELFLGTAAESEVLSDLDRGILKQEYGKVKTHTALEAATAVDCRSTDAGLRNMGRFLRLLEVEDNNSAHLVVGTVKRGSASVSRMPGAYMQEVDALGAMNPSWLHHLASVAEMRRDIPYSYIAAVGDRHTSSAVVVLFESGVPAGYTTEFRAHRWSGGQRVLTADDALVLAGAFGEGIPASYLGAALKMGMKLPEVRDAAVGGVAFEYLAAYYMGETV